MMTHREIPNTPWSRFIAGSIHAVRQYFAPWIMLTRWIERIVDEGMEPPRSTYTLPPVVKQSLLSAADRLGISPSAALELAILQLRERAQSGARPDSGNV